MAAEREASGGDDEVVGVDVAGFGSEDGLVEGLGLSVEASGEGERVKGLGVGEAGEDDEDDVEEPVRRVGVSAPQLPVP